VFHVTMCRVFRARAEFGGKCAACQGKAFMLSQMSC